MSVDIVKQLERAKRFVEKNKLDDAIECYASVLEAYPNHLESIQSLGDLYTIRNQPDRAAIYYGTLFDRFISPREEPKALALYSRFLKAHQQPPERVARYALLLQKQNRAEEAIEQFTSAAMAFEFGGKADDALACFVRIAQLDSENRDRHIAVAEMAERLGNTSAAARGYLRAAQLSADNNAEALEYFAHAHKLVPEDRSAALLYAQALMRTGDSASATALLEPLAEAEADVPFLETFTDALMNAGRLDAARTILERLTLQGAGSAERFFALVKAYLHAGHEKQAVDLLSATKNSMIAARRESEFAIDVDQIVAEFPNSIPLAEFSAAMYSEMNRESRYFDSLVALFDLYLANQQIQGACETLDRLVEIDPYDSRNHGRMEKLEGKADASFLTRIRARASKAATHSPQPAPQEGAPAQTQELSPAILEDAGTGQSLEDLLVQAEIFVQYSLHSKAVERLQKIAELFPGEEEHNERLRGLFQAARWWPSSKAGETRVDRPRPAQEAPAPVPAAPPETMRDLSRISEINQNIFRQPSPRAMLSTAVNEIGTYLRVSRCLAVVGTPGQPPQMASEFCASGVEPASGASIVRLIGHLERAVPNSMGGLQFDVAVVPEFREMGVETVLAVQLTDPESQAPSGMLIVCSAEPRAWKPNENYFLQSIGDQMLLCVQHMRLRSLVRNLAVADEKTGLLARGSYIDCLLHESQRARTQALPLALALLQVDGAADLLRQHGEAPFDRYMEQLGKSVQSIVRQSDLAVKYTSWALAFILPETTLAGARMFAEKLKKATNGLRPPWGDGTMTTSVAVAEAVVKHEYDSEDIVTDLINRAEAGLEEARKRGGNEIVSFEMAKN